MTHSGRSAHIPHQLGLASIRRSSQAASVILVAVIVVLVLLLATVAALAKGRDTKWGLVVWLPAVVGPVYLSASLLGVLPGRVAGPGPDVGAVAMASGFYLMAVLPIIALMGIVVLVALFLFPRPAARNTPGALGGLGACLVFVVAWSMWRNERAEVVVLNEMGKPVAGQKVTFSYSAFGTGRTLGSAVTDQDGRAHVRAPRDNNWSATTTTDDGTRCGVGCGKPEVPLPGHPELWSTHAFWQHPSWTIWFGSSTTAYVPRSAPQPLPLHLRSGQTLVSPVVLAAVRSELSAQTAKSRPTTLGQIDSHTIEIYALMPELIAATRRGFLDPDDSDRLLRTLAGCLARAHEACRQPANRKTPEGAFLFGLLQEWADPDHKANDEAAAAAIIQSRVVALADELVTSAEAYWADRGPVGLSELGNLAAPYAPRLLTKMEKLTDERRLPAYLEMLTRQKTAVQSLRPFFSHINRLVAVSAILAAESDLSPEEKSRLLAPYSQPGIKTWLQNRIEDALRPNRR